MCQPDGGIHHCFSLSGWLKIIESFAVFTLIMLHRIGDNTNQVHCWFLWNHYFQWCQSSKIGIFWGFRYDPQRKGLSISSWSWRGNDRIWNLDVLDDRDANDPIGICRRRTEKRSSYIFGSVVLICRSWPFNCGRRYISFYRFYIFLILWKSKS